MSVNGAMSLRTAGRVGHVIELEGGYLLNEVFWVVKLDCPGRFVGRLNDRIESS
jgi:hypothetical protein